MDPLSIAASVAGLLALSGQIYSVLQAFIQRNDDVPKHVRLVLSEITAMKAIFRQIQEFIDNTQALDDTRASLLSIQDLVTVLTGCVCVYSLLEKEVLNIPDPDHVIRKACGPRSLSEHIEQRDRDLSDELAKQRAPTLYRLLVMRWRYVEREPLFGSILEDLRAHKQNLSLMLTVLNCNTSTEALSISRELKDSMAAFRSTDSDVMARTNELMSRGQHPADVEDIQAEAQDNLSILSRRSFIKPFEKVLRASRPYKSKLVWNEGYSLASSAFKHTRWTSMSDVSLSDVSNIAVVDLPIFSVDLWSYEVYDGGWQMRSQKQLLKAAESGDCENIIDALEEGCCIEAHDRIGRTALLWAAQRGHAKAVELLLERGASLDATFKGTTTNCLVLAASGGHEEVVDILLKYGAYINYDNGSALLEAVNGQHDSLVRKLVLAGIVVNYQDLRTRRTSLHEVARRGDASLVQLLLDHGANVKLKDHASRSARRLAIIHGHHDVAEMLR